MYLLHFRKSTMSQKGSTINSALLCGFTSCRMNSFSSWHMLSIGFRSGDSGGVFHQFIPSLLKKVAACLEVCLGSLSCISQCESG